MIITILLNMLWLVLGGVVSTIGWLLAGLMWCVTIVGIPIGIQCFKLSALSFSPFGKEVEFEDIGAVSFLMNVAWFLLTGIELAAINFLIGALCCLTIVGIPFGIQYFKIARLSLSPFGARIAAA